MMLHIVDVVRNIVSVFFHYMDVPTDGQVYNITRILSTFKSYTYYILLTIHWLTQDITSRQVNNIIVVYIINRRELHKNLRPAWCGKYYKIKQKSYYFVLYDAASMKLSLFHTYRHTYSVQCTLYSSAVCEVARLSDRISFWTKLKNNIPSMYLIPTDAFIFWKSVH